MYKFPDVHNKAAGTLARIAREMGVEKYIHFSAMNVNNELPTHYIPGGSRFLRSKVSMFCLFILIFHIGYCCSNDVYTVICSPTGNSY